MEPEAGDGAYSLGVQQGGLRPHHPPLLSRRIPQLHHLRQQQISLLYTQGSSVSTSVHLPLSRMRIALSNKLLVWSGIQACLGCWSRTFWTDNNATELRAMSIRAGFNLCRCGTGNERAMGMPNQGSDAALGVGLHCYVHTELPTRL